METIAFEASDRVVNIIIQRRKNNHFHICHLLLKQSLEARAIFVWIVVVSGVSMDVMTDHLSVDSTSHNAIRMLRGVSLHSIDGSDLLKVSFLCLRLKAVAANWLTDSDSYSQETCSDNEVRKISVTLASCGGLAISDTAPSRLT